jgi:hypothetical protein
MKLTISCLIIIIGLDELPSNGGKSSEETMM